MRSTSSATRVLTGATLALAVSLTALLPATASAAVPDAEQRAGAKRPAVALKAYAYGTRVAGGDVPVGSTMTAFTAIGCATKPGITQENEVADVNLPGLGTVSAVKTRLWTVRRGGTLHSYARSSTAAVVLADTALGTLRVRGVSSLSHAWHDGSKFRAATKSSVATIQFVPPGGGEPVELDLPTPGTPLVVPGLARITLGGSAQKTTADHAIARASALRIQVLPTDTEVFVARSTAQAMSGVQHGVFSGYSTAIEADALTDTVQVGRNPLSLMPCQGTDGKVEKRALAGVDVPGVLTLDGLNTAQRARQQAGRSTAWERAKVAGIDLGDGALTIDGIVAKATVSRTAAGKLKRSTAGTSLGRITVGGQVITPPELPAIDLPAGIASIETNVVERKRHGLKVVALRITLLEGAGATIDVGVAKTMIRPR